MAVRVITRRDAQEFAADSYQYDRKNEAVVLRVFNLASCEEVIDTLETYDFFSGFDLIAEYSGGYTKEISFVQYKLVGCTVTHKPAGTVLEIYLKRMEVV